MCSRTAKPVPDSTRGILGSLGTCLGSCVYALTRRVYAVCTTSGVISAALDDVS
jgi:hypothetical protein